MKTTRTVATRHSCPTCGRSELVLPGDEPAGSCDCGATLVVTPVVATLTCPRCGGDEGITSIGTVCDVICKACMAKGLAVPMDGGENT